MKTPVGDWHMILFIWENIDNVSESYHNDGGLVVIAKDLEAAREFLRTPYEYKWTTKSWGNRDPMTDVLPEEHHSRMKLHVPENCDAFTKEPSFFLPVHKYEDPRVFVFPNAGCC